MNTIMDRFDELIRAYVEKENDKAGKLTSRASEKMDDISEYVTKTAQLKLRINNRGYDDDDWFEETKREEPKIVLADKAREAIKVLDAETLRMGTTRFYGGHYSNREIDRFCMMLVAESMAQVTKNSLTQGSEQNIEDNKEDTN